MSRSFASYANLPDFWIRYLPYSSAVCTFGTKSMELKQFYDGQSFPPYLYKAPIIELKATSGGGLEGHFDLPMSDRRLQRELESP